MTDDLTLYRAHRFQITRLETGEFALFSPSGEVIGIGSLDELAPMILTGEAHYEQCIDTWISHGRPTSAGSDLLAQLGLPTTQAGPVTGKLERRI